MMKFFFTVGPSILRPPMGSLLTGLISEVVFIWNRAYGHGWGLTKHFPMNIIVQLTCIYLLNQLQAHKTNIHIQNYLLS